MSCTVKRTFEAIGEPANAHAQRTHVQNVFGTPPKRCRGALAPTSPAAESSSSPRKTPFRPSQTPSLFKPESSFNLDNLEQFLPKTKRVRVQKSTEADNATHVFPVVQKKDTEISFTAQQVREIVQRAVEEREQSLREEYDRILKEKLAEQFENFSKFNQDYISRQLKESHWDYMI